MSTVVVIGGGAVGCATALHLKTAEPSMDVAVVEADFTYAKAATGKGTGGVRQLFTRPENILMSQYMLDVVDDWPQWGSVNGTPAPDLGWRPNGYLFIAGNDDADTLAANFDTHQRCGVAGVEWLDHGALARRYPQLSADGLVAAVLSPRDGWLDPAVFFAVLRAKTAAAGVRFVPDRVTGFGSTRSMVRTVELDRGRPIAVDAVVNAAGVHAPRLAAQLGMHIPVEPMRRHEHYVETESDCSLMPFVKDVDGLAVHAYRDGVSVGKVDFDHRGGEDDSIDPTDYTDRVEPALAKRFAGLGTLTRRKTWTGLYDQNRFDGNMIIGNWPGRLDNFHVACGFSGHGFMHALAVGRGLTESITTGGYQSLDLSAMGYQRVLDNQPYAEEGVR